MTDAPRTLPLEAILVRDRHRSDLGDIAGLAESIRESGLLQPVVVWPEGNTYRLIAGERRLAALRLLDIEDVAVRVVHNLTTAQSRLIAERDENTCRKDMTVSEKVALADALMELERPLAAERQQEGRIKGAHTSLGSQEPKDSRSPANRAAGAAAISSGLGSRGTYVRAKEVLQAAAEPEAPEEIKAIAAGMDAGDIPVVTALRQVREHKQASNAAPPARQSREAIDARRTQMREMAASGGNASQIAKAVGMTEAGVKAACKDHGIHLIADEVMGRSRRPDSNRVVEETVLIAAGLTGWEDLVNLNDLDAERLEVWASSLGTSIRSLTSLKNAITKELARASA